MLVKHRLLLRGTSYQRLACSDPTSCGLSLPFFSHYFPGSYLIPLEPITLRSVLTFEASLEPRGSYYRVFISVGRSQARKFSLGWFPGGRLKPWLTPGGLRTPGRTWGIFLRARSKTHTFHPNTQAHGPALSWTASIILSHLVTLNSCVLEGPVTATFQSGRHWLQEGLKVTLMGQGSTFFILITMCLF